MKKGDFCDRVLEKAQHGSFSQLDQAILAYAEQLTVNPHGVTQEHVVRLRDLGLEDRAILDLCQITSYFNFVNRMAEGLGVELES